MISDQAPRDPRKPDPPMLPEVQIAEDPVDDVSLGWNIAGGRALRWFKAIMHAVRMGWRR